MKVVLFESLQPVLSFLFHLSLPFNDLVLDLILLGFIVLFSQKLLYLLVKIHSLIILKYQLLFYWYNQNNRNRNMFKTQTNIRLNDRNKTLSPQSLKPNQQSHVYSCTTKDQTQKIRTFSQKKLTITSASNNQAKKFQSDVNKFYRSPVRPNLTLQTKKPTIEQNMGKVSLKKLNNPFVSQQNQTLTSMNSISSICEGRQSHQRQIADEVCKKYMNYFTKQIEQQQHRIREFQRLIRQLNSRIDNRNAQIQSLRQILGHNDKIMHQRIQSIKRHEQITRIKELQLEKAQSQLNSRIQLINKVCVEIAHYKVKTIQNKSEQYIGTIDKYITNVSYKLQQVITKLPCIMSNINDVQSKLQQSTKQSINMNWEVFQDFNTEDDTLSTASEDYFFYPKSAAFIASSRASQRKKDKLQQLTTLLQHNYELPLSCTLDRNNKLIELNNNMYLLDKRGNTFTVSEDQLKFLIRQKYVKMAK